MSLDPAQLAALNAILRLGSFDAAAQQLNLSQPAISQRIKALEENVGSTLINRGPPCTGTPLGARLAKHAEDLALLEAQALGQATPARTTPRVSLAGPADALATWMIPALSEVPDLLFDIQVDDQDTADTWLRRGAVSAAVTGHDRAAPGCDIFPLGALRYVAVASPAFVAAHFAQGVTAETLRRAPVLNFTSKDKLQSRWMKDVTGQVVHPPSHQIPSTHAFLDAARSGMAWSMNPLSLVQTHLETGTLVPLVHDRLLDVPLYWQITRVMAPALRGLTLAIQRVARDHLKPL